MEVRVNDHVGLSIQARVGGVVIPAGRIGRVIAVDGDDVTISWVDMDRLQMVQGSVSRRFIREVQPTEEVPSGPNSLIIPSALTPE